MLYELFVVFCFVVLSLLISSVIVVASIVLVTRSTDIEKVSSYECGFHPFQDTRNEIDIRFYLVAMLFLIFDLELTFLFPWSIALLEIGFFGYIIMLVFLWILILGFFFEWKKGALEWE